MDPAPGARTTADPVRRRRARRWSRCVDSARARARSSPSRRTPPSARWRSASTARRRGTRRAPSATPRASSRGTSTAVSSRTTTRRSGRRRTTDVSIVVVCVCKYNRPPPRASLTRSRTLVADNGDMEPSLPPSSARRRAGGSPLRSVSCRGGGGGGGGAHTPSLPPARSLTHSLGPAAS